MRLIDADALIDEMKERNCNGCDNNHGVRCMACRTGDAIWVIDMAPTVEPKRGRWTAINPCHGYSDEFDCSVCGRRVYLFPLMKDCDYEYCPNCGARMENETNTEEETEK